ncbi:MAG: DUF308 domain-containing protein [Alphaproteobacteria bacterium]|nr:DUF308 domain-containing protein [Alphaproteobacteria bacterium]MBN2675010.1 DUF308 domain-containing protein [Alphaproteobacteria bacterium]
MVKPIKPKKTVRKIKQKSYNKTSSFLLIEAILFGFAALFIFIKPVQILTSLTFIFGMILTFFGLYQTITGINEKKASGKNMHLVFGIINLILGLIFFIAPSGAMITIVYVLAIMFFVKAIKSLILSIKLYKAKAGNYKFEVIMSSIMVFLSSFVLFFPRFGIVTFMYYIGIMLTLYAIADIRMYKNLSNLKS